jgi:hypothetical protein
MQFQIFKKYILLINIYMYFKILSLIQNIFNIIKILFLRFMGLLFYFQLLIGVICHSPKSFSSAETDLVESTTVQQLWATKKLILDIFSIRPNCQL